MSELSTVCGCNHRACYHPSDKQQAEQIKATDGRYAGECKGGVGSHCRCVVSREEVISRSGAEASRGSAA